jgi:hypothetical protein
MLGAAAVAYVDEWTDMCVCCWDSPPCSLSCVAQSSFLPLLAIEAVQLLESATLEAEAVGPRGASHENRCSLRVNAARQRRFTDKSD